MAGKASLLASGFFILGWRECCDQFAVEGVGRGCLSSKVKGGWGS